jgi:hypothetical protein
MRLKTSHRTYVVVDQNGEILHFPTPSDQAFKSVLSAASPPFPAPGSREAAITEGPLAPSTLVVLPNGFFAFRRDGLYLCADPAISELRFDREEPGPWESFAIETSAGREVRYPSDEAVAPPLVLFTPVLIETPAGYLIMSGAADANPVIVTWPEFSKEPLNRYALPDGSWVVDVESTSDPDQPFLVYWFYPFEARIHVWRLDRFGRRLFGYNLSETEARFFLLARRARGPAFNVRLYLMSQTWDQLGLLPLICEDLLAGAEAGLAEALYCVIRHPTSWPPSTIQSLASHAFNVLRAANRARGDEAERRVQCRAVDALAEALSQLDPALGGFSQGQLQGELDFRDFFANPVWLPQGACALPLTLHCHTPENLAVVLEGATSQSIGILLRPSMQTLEFHYVHSTGGIRQRVIDSLCYAYYVICTNNAVMWKHLAAQDPAAQAWMIRFDVGDLPSQHGSSVAFERMVADTTSALVPDSYYFGSKGFRSGWFAEGIPPWSKKATRFVWRGSTSGAYDLNRETLAQAPRVRLCELGRALGPVADFGITDVVQARSEVDAEDIKLILQDRGLWRERMPQHVMASAKFLIEIDGNANSWGFFAKLLMGCCILKVDSPFEQWFYKHLRPWVHYVPVAQDLSDLADKVQWCLRHERDCRKIADSGRSLAESLTFDTQIAEAANAFLSVAKVSTYNPFLSNRKRKLLISHIDDIYNIYHLFVGEIDAIWKTTLGDPDYEILLKHYVDDAAGRWRVDLLNSMYRNVYIHEIPNECIFEKISKIKNGPYGMVDNLTFSQINPSRFHIAMADRLKERYNVRDVSGQKIVYVERGRSRILFDYKTKSLLSNFLSAKAESENLPFEIVNFDNATFEFQLKALSHAKILLSCHGAANTNLFLLPKNATLFEVNFRKYWFCDPVCSRHLSGEISYQTDCGGPLTWKDVFHKAEYHNMAQLYGIGYKEFQIKDAENFLSENPIALENIFVDGDEIFEEICSTMRR